MENDDRSSWEPIVTDRMKNSADLVQNQFDNMVEDQAESYPDPYSIVLDEFDYRTQRVSERDPDTVSELVRELIPYITTTAAVIESASITVLIFYIVDDDKIYNNRVYQHFSNMTQGQRGMLLESLDLLPRQLAQDMIKFNGLRNVVIHEYESHYTLQKSEFDENEFGDALLAGVRSVQGLHDLRDQVAPDVVVSG